MKCHIDLFHVHIFHGNLISQDFCLLNQTKKILMLILQKSASNEKLVKSQCDIWDIWYRIKINTYSISVFGNFSYHQWGSEQGHSSVLHRLKEGFDLYVYCVFLSCIDLVFWYYLFINRFLPLHFIHPLFKRNIS